jgi:glutamate---cysteine ligase / carboxylate-amine ligase
MRTMSELPTSITRDLVHAYGESPAWSIGIEEEFQLVDTESLALVPRVESVLGLASDSDRRYIKQELMQSIVEVATPPCTTVAQARVELEALRSRVADLARESGCLTASAGTHPFSRYELQSITDAERYHQLVDRLRWVAQRELIFGMHVHVGIGSPEQATYVFNHLRCVLPELLALSANSPFWQGRDTGLASSRSTVFASFPRSGIPPSFDTWEDWTGLVRRAMRAGAIDDYTYLWWDVRPHPKFGTVEVRVCDAQTRVDDTLALAAVIQATAAWLGARFDAGDRSELPPQFLIEENKWSAARHGVAGEFIDLGADERISTRAAIERLLDEVADHAAELGSSSELDHARTMLDETGADRQRAAHAERRDLRDVARVVLTEPHATVRSDD